MSLSNRFILAGVAYGVIGFVMGIAMASMQDYSLKPVHSHIGLLGWVSMVLYGLIYRSYSAMAEEKLANWQFYISNIGLIGMMLTLAMVVKGNQSVVMVLVISEVAVVIGMLLFAWLVWKHRNA
ncbi:MAG: cytochrome-c oxidase [Gammaproteobacteria bacterium]|nr:cytochrome-c oxidase [Gammaproteobacteria bacterium]